MSICGQVKPGTYSSGHPIPIPACDLNPEHVGMHHAIVWNPAKPQGGTEYQWAGSIEIQQAVCRSCRNMI